MLALIAVLAAALLGMAALAIDIGYAAMQQQRLEVFAEASAMAALREEGRFRFELARAASLGLEPNCEAGAQREACVNDSVQSSEFVEAVHALVLESGGSESESQQAEVSLGPASPVGGPRPCELEAGPCWQTEVTQSLPLLFGQGSMLGFEEGTFGAMMDARERGDVLVDSSLEARPTLRTQGIGIQSVARVETRPAIRVGAEERLIGPGGDLESRLLPGRAPFALRLGVWQDLLRSDSGTVLVLEVDDSDGSLSIPVLGQPNVRVTAGRRLADGDALRAGQVLVGQNEWSALESRVGAYVPLFVTTEANNEELVVGFGFAEAEVGSGTPLLISLTPYRSQLGPGNATASPRLWVEGGAEIPQRIEDVLALREDTAFLLQAPVFR